MLTVTPRVAPNMNVNRLVGPVLKGGHGSQQWTQLLKERSYNKYCSFELKLQLVSEATTKGLLSLSSSILDVTVLLY